MVAEQGSIRERIESQLSKLGAKQRVAAEYILANPTTILFASAVEVAKASHVDPATVVRLAQRLGYSGYPEFREHLRTENSVNLPHMDQILETGHAEGEDPHTLKQRVFEQTMTNVERTFEHLDWHAIEQSITCMLNARRVVIIGAGLSRGMAHHLGRVLQSAQIPILILEDWYDLLFEAASFQDTDVLFAVTAQRYSTVSIRTLREARESGTTTIMLTDATFAPGIASADIVLLFSPRSIGEFYSPVGGTAIIDCIAAGLGARVPDKIKQSLERQIELAIEHDISYW